MTMESFATPYPVIFYDGEQEHDKGQIGVHSVLPFKRFQALLSQKTGLPANQLSAVFVCKRTAKDTNKRQKLPINENTNFSIILNQHNPSREKDCHFLVSLKKSKKERKGTTKRRTAESENGDEDESISPRRDVSPDERTKGDSSADSASSPDASSPTTEVPQLFSGGHQNGQILFGTPFSDGKSPGTEKILLRRETRGQVSSVSPVVVWQNDRQNEIQGNARSSSSQTTHINAPRTRSPLSTTQQEDMQLSEKQIIQNEYQNHRPVEIVTTSMPLGQSPQLRSFTSRAELSQERHSYSITSPVRPAVLLQRNGILTPPTPAASGTPFSPVPTLTPHVYPTSVGAGTVLSRVPTGASGGLSHCSSAAWNLQQAQAHYLSLQKQHPGHMQMNSQAITKMKGVVRGLASIDRGNHQSSAVCGYCCSFKEKKINPMPFHLCAQDQVTMGFRGPSPAGPIERPVKRLEAAA
eukprot:c27634_g2_i1 orf=288-1688(-)